MPLSQLVGIPIVYLYHGHINNNNNILQPYTYVHLSAEESPFVSFS